MNIFKRWRREGMRRRLANMAAWGFNIAHWPQFMDKEPRDDLHRAEINSYLRGLALGERHARDVQVFA